MGWVPGPVRRRPGGRAGLCAAGSRPDFLQGDPRGHTSGLVQDLPGPDLKRGQGGKGELGGAEVVEGQGQLKPHYLMDQPPPKSWWGLGSPEGCLTAGWPAPDE